MPPFPKMSFLRKLGEAFGMPPSDRFSLAYLQVPSRVTVAVELAAAVCVH